MKARNIIKYLLILILTLCLFTACSKKVTEVKTEVELPKYSEVTVLKKSNNNSDAYQAKTDGLYKIGSQIGNVSEMVYSTTGKAIVQSEVLSKGENLNKNRINIYRDGKLMVLDKFYSAQNLKMNNLGNFLAFRCYSKDSLDSAQGLKIFDLDSREIINIESKVLVSGSVYNWSDEKSILYYGTIPEVKDSIKIYKYNIQEKKEEVYCDNIDGSCLYLLPVKEDVIYLKSQGDSTEIDYFNYKNKSKTVISTEISEIYSAKYDSITDEVYFTGKADSNSCSALYKISMKSLKVTRLTFKFPENIDIDSEISEDSSGNIYFTGAKGVFMYDYRKRSVNLISTSSGDYKIYGNVNN